MKRRRFLHSIASAAAVIAAPLPAAHAGMPSAPARTTRVRPADAAWPDAAAWAGLSAQVGGTLSAVHALFATGPADATGAACADALTHIGNPYWIADQPAGTEISGWLDAWTPAPSAYAVKARDAHDVAAAVSFARAHRLRLVVKGGGHSYQGTSNAPDSLLVWTRALDTVTLHAAFVGAGCEGSAPVPAVSAGAGAVWMDLYQAVSTEAGRYVQGGGCMTVGVAGLVQSGGFNQFSKCYGSAASSLIEAEIVTADGQIRVVNARQHADLFWALQGGGGGSFGVVTRVTLRTHDLPRWFGAAWGKIQARSDAAYARLIARFIAFYEAQLFNPHWSEHVHFRTDNVLELDMIGQGLDSAAVAAIWAPLFDWVRAAPDDFSIAAPLGTGAWPARAWWDLAHKPSMQRDTRPGAPRHHGWSEGDQGEVGIYLHGYDSLWLPATLLAAQRQPLLADAIFAATRHQMVRFHFGKGLAGATPEVRAAARGTATNPLMADAFTLVIIADGERPPAYPGMARAPVDVAAARRDARAIDRAAAALRKIAPDSGSYVSESNYFNSAWQRDFWGSNYARLRAIKDQVDPDGLFIVHHGVGSEDWDAAGFTRLR